MRKGNRPARRRLLAAAGVILAAALGFRLLAAADPLMGSALSGLAAPAAGLFGAAPSQEPVLAADLVPGGGALPPLSSPAQATPSPTPLTGSGDGYPVIPVTIEPSSSKGYVTAQGIYLKNQTSLTIDLNRALSMEPDLALTAGGPQVLIVHTHGTESYLQQDQATYAEGDIARTQDPEKNVLRVGDAIQSVLESRGLTVLHDTTLYDSPSYAGSYTRALAGIQQYLKDYPSIQVVIDVHRDALQDDNLSMYNTVTEIEGEKTAQVMLVMGTDQSGLQHPDWTSNLRLAARVQKRMTERYPTLARPLNLRQSRFNQHLTPGSLLVEVGTAVSTMDEAVRAGKLFADCAADVLLGYLEQ